jgi:hypothetical protein
MTCLDIKKKIKPFIDDLLAEDEYQDFISHLDVCGECRAYASTLGSISNQLWKLGNVDVPPDFASAVFFKLRQLEQQAPQPKTAMTKRQIAIVFAVVIIAVAVFMGAWYLKKRSLSSASTKMPQDVKGAVSDKEAEDLIIELQVIADSIGATKKDAAVPSPESSAPAEQAVSETGNK